MHKCWRKKNNITDLFTADFGNVSPDDNGNVQRLCLCVQSRLMRLLQRLPASVVRRVHRERHAAPSWVMVVPESQKLTDADLEEFTRSLSGAALLAMFRYCTVVTSVQTLKLALLHQLEKTQSNMQNVHYNSDYNTAASTHLHIYVYSIHSYVIDCKCKSVFIHMPNIIE